MKVGTDGTLLGAWAKGNGNDNDNGRSTFGRLLPKGRKNGNGNVNHNDNWGILDVGTGTGLIALMMAQRFPEAKVLGIDIDAEAVAQAQENVAASPFADRITILHQDFSTLLTSHPSSLTPFNAIVCNPPFFTNSLPCPDDKRTMARHDNTLTYRTLVTHAFRLLSDDGELSVIIPADQQSRMEAEAALAGFSLSRECKVSTAPGKPPKRVLLAFRKHPTTPQRTTLTIGSTEYQELTKDFYL